jgi:hypothetical protein
MTMPNFLVLGAAKCGTDALCNYLAQHPDVFVSPNREPTFFVSEGSPTFPYTGPGDRRTRERFDMWVSSLEHYQSLFSGVTSETAIGEGTTWYMYFEDAPTRIRRHIPDARLIAVLRNPVDRAYSAYTMLLREGRESISDFGRALAAEEERTRRNWEPIWHYAKMGFYARQIQRYWDVFDREQLKIVIYDDFNANPQAVVSDLYGFLEVDRAFIPDTSKRYNVSMVPNHVGMHNFISGEHPLKAAIKAVVPAGLRQGVKQKLVDGNLRRPTPMPAEVRRQLVEVFREDVLELEEMLGRDLSRWRRAY